MSWNLLLVNSKHNTNLFEDTEKFGAKKEFMDKISKIFPEIVWEKSNYGKLRDSENEDLFVDFVLGDEEELGSHVLLADVAGGKSHQVLKKICQEYGWQVFDLGSGERIDF